MTIQTKSGKLRPKRVDFLIVTGLLATERLNDISTGTPIYIYTNERLLNCCFICNNSVEMNGWMLIGIRYTNVFQIFLSFSYSFVWVFMLNDSEGGSCGNTTQNRWEHRQRLITESLVYKTNNESEMFVTENAWKEHMCGFKDDT